MNARLRTDFNTRMSDSANANAASIPQDAGTAQPDQGVRGWIKWLPLGSGALALLLLFFVWPYQHWDELGRSSVMSGWFRVVGESFNGEWMFCYVVPFIVGFLVHLRRDELRKLPTHGEWAGLAILAVGLFFYWAGYKVDTGYAGFFALQVIVAGLIILLGGWQWMRVLFFAWLFLVFMWPMLPIEERIVGKLRLITAALSGEVLHLMGIGVVREGTALSSAADAAHNLRQGDVFRLDVEEPCSGVRSLYSLLMVSALYGYLSLKRTFPRVILFASAVPLAMMGNVVRMVLLAIGSMWFGTEFAVGRNLGADHQEMSTYHTLCGYVVFAVALAGMFGLCTLLEGSHWKALKNLKKRGGPKVAVRGDLEPDTPRRTVIMSAVSIVMAVVGMGICYATNLNPTVAEPGVVLNLPLQFGKYQGISQDMTALERNILDPGVGLVRNQYISADRDMVVATVILSGLGKRTLHRPEVCLPGQGWNITDRMPVTVKLAGGRTIEAMLLRMFRDFEPSPGQRRRMRAMNIYWYIGSDGTTSAEFYDHVRISYMDGVLKNLTHRWAMASFFAPLPDTDIMLADPMREVAALEELRDFAGRMAGEFMKNGGK